ncbi:MAG: hypothetical protein RR269_06815 [Oscillospiraceae bacterium]
MKTFQNWGDESTAQQTKEAYTNELLEEQQILQMRSHASQVAVNGAAKVSRPPVQAPAAKQSYKERREHAKKEKLAKKLCPIGTAEALDLASLLKISEVSRGKNMTSDRIRRARAIHIDERNLGSFADPFNINSKGLPASPEDEAVKQRNDDFAEDYLSNDATRRMPFLVQTKNDFINESFNLKESDLSTENVLKNGFELKRRADLFVGIEAIQRENRAFFPKHENPDEQTFEEKVLKEQEAVNSIFSSALIQKMAAVGVDAVSARIYSYSSEDQEAIQQGEMMQAVLTEGYKDLLPKTKARTQKLFEDEVKLRAKRNVTEVMYDGNVPLTEDEKDVEESTWLKNALEGEIDNSSRSIVDAYKRQDQLLTIKYGVSFPDGASELQYADMKHCRDMIANNGGAYVNNRELIDLIYTDFYRALSLVGSKTMEKVSYQTVCDEVGGSQNDLIQKNLGSVANEMMTKSMVESGSIERRASRLQDLMSHLLRDKPMNDETAELLEKYRAKVQNPGQADDKGGDN